MEHQRSQSGKPPVDEIKLIPLPCYGRGHKLVPLDELPLFQYLKRQAALQGKLVPEELGRPPQKHHHSSDDSSDAEHKDIGSSGGSHEMPLCAPALNVGLELMQPAQERSEVLCQPSTSQQSPGPQSLHLADRHRYIPHTSGPPTSWHQQTDRPSHSIQPSPPTTKQCDLVPPAKGLPKGPSGSDCHGGARRKMPATSPNRGQGTSWSPRKGEPPAKKVAFDSDTLNHPKDHSSWAEFLNKGVTRDPVDDSEGDLTICRDAEAEHYESDSPSTGGKPAAAVKDEPMETEDSEEPKKGEVESEDYEMVRVPVFLEHPLE
ncbi:uncharacterized protein [Dermacentor albipictus]|uniref:uncharacterized protein isoform X2 n=1 Tax=Dermacentor albipictus TaxID=60249 RepID=UPI0031FCFC0A